jgi:hypothetical protein
LPLGNARWVVTRNIATVPARFTAIIIQRLCEKFVEARQIAFVLIGYIAGIKNVLAYVSKIVRANVIAPSGSAARRSSALAQRR